MYHHPVAQVLIGIAIMVIIVAVLVVTILPSVPKIGGGKGDGC